MPDTRTAQIRNLKAKLREVTARRSILQVVVDQHEAREAQPIELRFAAMVETIGLDEAERIIASMRARRKP